ncbi:hypothetical protein Plhal304r1_c019g0068051 [Plasmopara halstedii]
MTREVWTKAATLKRKVYEFSCCRDAADLKVVANGVALIPRASLADINEKETLVVQVSTRHRREKPHGLVGTSLTYADGINPSSIHFNGDRILTRMADWIRGENRFLHLNFPAASGETSLFHHKNLGLNARYVSAMSPWEILRLHGLDLVHERRDYENVIFMIDDAQFQYDDAVFWAALVKDVPMMVGPGVRFIISITHVISIQE